MLHFTLRCLRLYFIQKSRVFFSLLGALITFLLYLAFLKDNMASSWPQLPGVNTFLDYWLLGGILAIVGATTSAAGLSQMVADKEKGVLADFLLTDLSYNQMQFGYFLASALISLIMQVLALGLLFAYYALTASMTLSGLQLLQLLGAMVLSALVWTSFNVLLFGFVRRVTSFGHVMLLLSTSLGFFAGVYLPLGILPQVSRWVIQVTPAPYFSSLFRHILLAPTQEAMTQQVPDFMLQQILRHTGVGLDLGFLTSASQEVLILLGFGLLFLILMPILGKFSRKLALHSL
ncbi:ABC transporter permease [uncultured Abiotrophia sp.]|uniref:ABC transporter permease n=1 Tax=uncultured Abiotrophia sp. TaxID=316094 RepID=UPI002628E07A|nr:ABC transporter permease [uncultured Abiotrophia sp.]